MMMYIFHLLSSNQIGFSKGRRRMQFQDALNNSKGSWKLGKQKKKMGGKIIIVERERKRI